MKKIKKEIDVYVVGEKEFLDEGEAKEYEKELLKRLVRSYYIVSYNPDLTEGRGYYNKVIIGVSDSGHSNNTLYQYLVNELGNPFAFVMGVAPMDNWVVSDKYEFKDIESLDKFLNTEYPVGIGSYVKDKKLEVRYVDAKGKLEGKDSYDLEENLVDMFHEKE